jgi:hypothetical protein
MAPFKFIGISTWEFFDSDVEEILLRALCVDITGRVISARNFYSAKPVMPEFSHPQNCPATPMNSNSSKYKPI